MSQGFSDDITAAPHLLSTSLNPCCATICSVLLCYVALSFPIETFLTTLSSASCGSEMALYQYPATQIDNF